jgi:DNA-binding CsgD family transcriptional regulator/energy-coupling factor transporter ATP-binding protein EcfA2
MEAVWAEVQRGRRQVVFIGGEPGAGKSRLVAEVAGVLHEHNATVLLGTTAREGGVPYEPFAELLGHLFAASPPESLRSLLDGHDAQLWRLSGQVSGHQADLAEPAPQGQEQRRHLFDAVTAFLGRLAVQRPLVLVLEDLQWAQVPTLALLEHVVSTGLDTRMLVLATFRTTLPDRSEQLATRMAELHRLEGVQRVDLDGLDTDAISEYLRLHGGPAGHEARAPAALLRDRTGGNPFFLREMWADLQRRGGTAALRSRQPVPATISDSLETRIAGMGEETRRVLELAAVLGDEFDLSILIAANENDLPGTMAFLDATTALGLVEPVDPHIGRYCFVHALTRQAVLDRAPPSRLTRLHALAGEALEGLPASNALAPRLAHHFLAAHFLGYQDRAVRYCREAGRLAERSLAFEDAAAWFQRAASLPGCDPEDRSQLLLAAAADHVRSCDFPQARSVYEEVASIGSPEVRLAAALGFEDATWRPGVHGPRAADLLAAALADRNLPRDASFARAVGSMGRALALAGETVQARRVGGVAIDLARRLGDDQAMMHALTTSLWHGITPDMAHHQLERSAEVARKCRVTSDFETLGAVLNFRSTASYLLGRPDELRAAFDDARSAAEHTSMPFYRFVYCGHSHAAAFLRGDFADAERWARETLKYTDSFGNDVSEGPFSVQMFMVNRETDALGRFGPLLDGTESFGGRWIPGLLALYTEVGQEKGMRRALAYLFDQELTSRSDEAQWPMELAFLSEAALRLRDVDAVRALRPLLAEYEGMNLVCGTLVATFGSADRYLGRIAAMLGEDEAAVDHLEAALAMDRRMHSVVHTAETLAHTALYAAETGRSEQARMLAAEARGLACAHGQQRVIRLLAPLAPVERPAGLTEREVEVLGLLAAGQSNQEIGASLFISTNTAANHVRSILLKTGAANRTQAAIYAAQHDLGTRGR